jgi:hypothetical protein
MLDQKDPWTTALVILVSIISVQLGAHNLAWGLNTVDGFVKQLEIRNSK